MTTDNQQQNPHANRRLDFTKNSFTANGKEYFIETSLAITRYCEYQILEKELAFKMTFKAMYDHFVNMDGLLNKVQFVDAAVANRNMIAGLEQLDEKQPSILKMCALFINTYDENRGMINDDMITTKIEDWKIAGIDIRDFFTLALNTMDGFTEVYSRLTQATSPTP